MYALIGQWMISPPGFLSYSGMIDVTPMKNEISTSVNNPARLDARTGAATP